ncbi:MAG TPA: hypothetical protein VN976_06135 [Verrucomicrobiae bacterium]|nr:hypothetical protein [Verrucomicrobiae bacterium]
MSGLQSVYGLRIAAEVPLPGLPIQSGTRPDVQIRLRDRSLLPAGAPISSDRILYVSPVLDERGDPNLTVARLAQNDSVAFFYSDGARFIVDRLGREVCADWPDKFTLEDACTYLLGPVIAFVLRLRGVTCLHASSVVVDGRAIVLFGPAGAGKSTTAAAFALKGYSVLSDDVAVLADLGDRFLVQPGYPRINLWRDSVRTLFGSEDALPRITPTWEKRYLALDQNKLRFQSSPLPLGAIYILGEREAELTAPVIEEVVGGEAIMALVANTYVNYLLDRDMRKREFDVLSRLLPGVPVRRVRPAADTSKIFALCERIAADATQLAWPDATRAALGAH